MNAIKTFSQVCEKIYKDEIEVLPAKLKSTNDLKTYVVEVIKTADRVMGRALINYPITAIISFIANVILTAIFPGIGTIIGLGMSAILFLRNQNYMVTSIGIYNAAEVSEWSANFDEKSLLEFSVNCKVEGNRIINHIVNFVNSFWN